VLRCVYVCIYIWNIKRYEEYNVTLIELLYINETFTNDVLGQYYCFKLVTYITRALMCFVL